MNEWLELLKQNDFLGIKKYIKNGGDVNAKNETGESVLIVALKNGCDEDIIQLLINSGANLLDTDNEGVSVFDTAIAYNYINLVKYLVKNKLYDVNKTTRKSGFTPLMCACSYGRIEIVKYLLQKGANKDITDNKGLNAFDFARKLHKNSVLKILNEKNIAKQQNL